MIRSGPRGAGQWRRASWEDALEYVADKLRPILRAWWANLVRGRTNLNTHINKAHEGPQQCLLYSTPVQGSFTAFRSLTGYTDPQMAIDYNTGISSYSRNILVIRDRPSQQPSQGHG
jgi:thiosulfate reductase/polysulfide reductase chain A